MQALLIYFGKLTSMSDGNYWMPSSSLVVFPVIRLMSVEHYYFFRLWIPVDTGAVDSR